MGGLDDGADAVADALTALRDEEHDGDAELARTADDMMAWFADAACRYRGT